MQTHEAERQFYLAMAGVQLWYAREPLPGAAPSPEFVFPVARVLPKPALLKPAGDTSAPARVAAPAHLPKGKPLRRADPAAAARIADLQLLMKAGKAEVPQANLRQPVKDVSANTHLGSEPAPAKVTSTPPLVEPVSLPAALSPSTHHPDPVVAVAQPLKVTLALWQGRHVSLIAALSSDASAKLQQTLAHNILHSLGEKEPGESVTVHWPVFNNLLVPGNQTQDLIGVLKPVLSSLNAQRLIVLGVDADDRVSAEHADAPLPSWLSEALPALKHPLMAFRFNLAALAAQPKYKRVLWSFIKAWVS